MACCHTNMARYILRNSILNNPPLYYNQVTAHILQSKGRLYKHVNSASTFSLFALHTRFCEVKPASVIHVNKTDCYVRLHEQERPPWARLWTKMSAVAKSMIKRECCVHSQTQVAMAGSKTDDILAATLICRTETLVVTIMEKIVQY
jgi:hypothetical protein